MGDRRWGGGGAPQVYALAQRCGALAEKSVQGACLLCGDGLGLSGQWSVKGRGLEENMERRGNSWSEDVQPVPSVQAW